MRRRTPVPSRRARPAAAALLALALLAGCGQGQPGPDAAADTSEPSTDASAGEAPAGFCAAPDPDEVLNNEEDVELLRGMIPHSEQAVIMSEAVLGKDGIDPAVAALAEEVVATEGPEIEEMRELLDDCGGEEPVAVDDHAAHGHGEEGGISGMLTAEELAELETAEGADAARLYLERMIAHSEGAVDMAQLHGEVGAKPEVLELSERVVEDQRAEVDRMKALLAAL